MRKQGITFHLLVLGLSTGAWAGQVRGLRPGPGSLTPVGHRAPGRQALRLPPVPSLPRPLAVPDVGMQIGPSLSADAMRAPEAKLGMAETLTGITNNIQPLLGSIEEGRSGAASERDSAAHVVELLQGRKRSSPRSDAPVAAEQIGSSSSGSLPRRPAPGSGSADSGDRGGSQGGSGSNAGDSEGGPITKQTLPGIYELMGGELFIVEARILNNGTLKYRYLKDGGVTRFYSAPWSFADGIVSAPVDDPGLEQGRMELDLSGLSLSELRAGAEARMRIPIYGQKWLPLKARKTDRPVFPSDSHRSPELGDTSAGGGVDFSGFLPARIERLEDGRSIAVGGLLAPPQAVNQVAQVTYDQKPGSQTFGKFLAVIGTVEGGRDQNMEPARLMDHVELKGLERALRRHLKENPPNPSRKALFEEFIDAMAKSARPPSNEESNAAAPKAVPTEDLSVSVIPMPKEISQKYQAASRRIKRQYSPIDIGGYEVETVYVHAAMARFQLPAGKAMDKDTVKQLLGQMGETKFLKPGDISQRESASLQERFREVLNAFEEHVRQVTGKDAEPRWIGVTDRAAGKGLNAEHFERMLVVYPHAGYALLVEVVFGL